MKKDYEQNIYPFFCRQSFGRSFGCCGADIDREIDPKGTEGFARLLEARYAGGTYLNQRQVKSEFRNCAQAHRKCLQESVWKRQRRRDVAGR